MKQDWRADQDCVPEERRLELLPGVPLLPEPDRLGK